MPDQLMSNTFPMRYFNLQIRDITKPDGCFQTKAACLTTRRMLTCSSEKLSFNFPTVHIPDFAYHVPRGCRFKKPRFLKQCECPNTAGSRYVV